uniref:Uncharacterized protein n=1 Tax=Cacopsylla melanoneura TaxID=428564 RepID=A0A8D9A6C5_9HEMI
MAVIFFYITRCYFLGLNLLNVFHDIVDAVPVFNLAPELSIKAIKYLFVQRMHWLHQVCQDVISIESKCICVHCSMKSMYRSLYLYCNIRAINFNFPINLDSFYLLT